MDTSVQTVRAVQCRTEIIETLQIKKPTCGGFLYLNFMKQPAERLNAPLMLLVIRRSPEPYSFTVSG